MPRRQQIRLAPIASTGTSQRYHCIKMKQCNRYKPSSDRTFTGAYTQCCECGEVAQFHDSQAISNGEDDPYPPWDSVADTILVQTKAYGEVKMAGLMTVRRAKFIRVADTEVDALLDLLFGEWQLERPDFVILMLGNLSDLDRQIKEGISRACTSTHPTVWVVGDAFNAVVMDNVWDKFSHYEVSPVVIGIAPWGQVALKHILADELGRGKWPASYLHSSPHPGQALDLSNMVKQNEFSLDKTYSHFLLIDNGTLNQQVDLSAFILACISKMQQKSTRVVNVLSGGEYRTLQLLRDIMNEGQNPAIIINHSGQAAQTVVNTVENNRRLTSQKAIQEELRRKFPELEEDSFLYQISLAKYGLCYMLHIYEKDNDLAGLIVTAAFGTMELKERFDHAINWRRPDIARDLLLAEDRDVQVWVDHVIYRALNTHQPNFLVPLLDLDIDFHISIDAVTLQNLYNKVVPTDAPLPRLLSQRHGTKKSEDRCSDFTLPEVAKVIKDLIGKFYKPAYSRAQFKKVKDGVNFQFRSEGAREILLWAVMNHYPELALKIWKRVSNPIAAALTACNILRALAEHIRSQEQKRQYLKTAEKFELLARDVLDQCYKSELEYDLAEPCTEYILIRQRDTFGFTTCLHLALTGHCQYFIEHVSVQALLDKIWLGQVASDNKSWKIVLCVLCPFLVYPLIYFRMDAELRDKRGRAISSAGWRRLPKSQSSRLSTMKSQLDIHKPHSSRAGFLRRLMYFYRSPLIIFSYNCITYLLFLSLFSYTMLSDYRSDGMTYTEMALTVWVGTLLAEEARQVIIERSNYFMFEVNWLDISAMLFYVLALGLRWRDVTFEAARYIMCLSLTLFYIRLLQIFAVFQNLGPLLVMIVEMLKDLIGFMFFISVFFVAYGVVWHAILHPDTPFTGLMFYSVLRNAYWPMHGEVSTFLDEAETGNCTMHNGTLGACSTAQLIAPPIMAIYILFVNILMFNLLIAIFSHRFSQIQPITKTIWSTLRYSLIREYYGRPPFPPPFILGCHFVQFFLYIIKCLLDGLALCTGKVNLGRSIRSYTWVWDREINILFGVSDNSELSAWECRNAEKLHKSRVCRDRKTTLRHADLDTDPEYKDLKICV